MSPSMKSPEDTTKSDSAREEKNPPAVYWPACGALCNVMWWARRAPDSSETVPAPVIKKD
jgi:hypothetical protein